MNTEDRGWKIDLISAAVEVLNHPKGGEVAFFVRVGKPGERSYNVVSRLYGRKREGAVHIESD